MSLRALALVPLVPLACYGEGSQVDEQETQVETQLTDRGQVQTLEIGALQVSYLSGKDAGPKEPVYDMSLGEISLRNTGGQSINLKYNSMHTFFLGHIFTFGTDVKKTHTHPRMEGSEPEDVIDYDLPPGQSLLISQQDLLVTYQELGRAYFLGSRSLRSLHRVFLGALSAPGLTSTR